MADGSKIEWTDATWNPITGCSVLTAGCTNCYAMVLAGTRLQHHWSREGLTRSTKAGPVWTGAVRFNDAWLTQPLRWRRPRMIFVCAHGDLFHEAIPDEWIDRVFAIMALAPQHTFQVLTKRSVRMRAYVASRSEAGPSDDPEPAAPVRIEMTGLNSGSGKWAQRIPWPLPNVWIGVSVEDQRRADERRDDLAALAEAGWATFVSYEPALGPVDWIGWEFLSWLISGGESGSGARPSDGDWHRAARDFGAKRGIPYLFKQWGSWIGVEDLKRLPGGQGPGFGRFDHCRYDQDLEAVMIGKIRAGRLLDGVEHNAMAGAAA